MLYLLKSSSTSYILCEQTATTLAFTNEGSWDYKIPYPVTSLDDRTEQHDGDIYWWEPKYPDHCDATLVRTFHTLDEYNLYMFNHPELLL